MKFNLMREETEGFSKVLSLLNTSISPQNVETKKGDLFALIGYFDLDPNRVLDLVLDVYAENIQNHAFQQLILAFKQENLPHLLGFKFQHYYFTAAEEASNPQEVEETPSSLYQLTATLITKKMLTISSILPHLSPEIPAIVERNVTSVDQIYARAKSYGVVSLTKSSTEDDMKAKDQAAVTEATEKKLDRLNQVYGLIEGLLYSDNWEAASELIEYFQSKNANPMENPSIAKAMCYLIRQYCKDLYEPLSKASLGLGQSSSSSALSPSQSSSSQAQVKPVQTYEEFLNVILPMLTSVGQQLHLDPFTFMMCRRLVLHLITVSSKSTAENQMIDYLVAHCILPSLSLIQCNPAATYECWNIIKAIPYRRRYQIYQIWHSKYTSHELILVEASTVYDTRKILRRLTSDNVKQAGRQFISLLHSNPLVVLDTLLGQIEAYDNLIQPIVDALKYVTPLGMDVLSYLLVCHLSSTRSKVKDDGTNTMLWLNSLSVFCGSVYRKYPTMELEGLLQFILERLKSWESTELAVLTQLLTKMGSVLSLEQISDDQIQSKAGGPTLGLEILEPKLQNRRSVPRLRDALMKSKLVVPLIILLSQQRTCIESTNLHANKKQHLKQIGRQYDQCQMVLNQLLEFLSNSVSASNLAQMMPSLQMFVQDYHVPNDVALSACRVLFRAADAVLCHAHAGSPVDVSSSSQNLIPEEDWNPYCDQVMTDIAEIFPHLKCMTPTFVITFWSLSLYDIYVPFRRYENEITRLRVQYNNTLVTTSEMKKTKEKQLVLIAKLEREQRDQVCHRKIIYGRLETHAPQFFDAIVNTSNMEQILESCIIPRAVLAPEEALYCAKFIEHLHAMSTPKFSSLGYYHLINMTVPPMVLSCTEREAEHLGIFLRETHALLLRWQRSSVEYNKEALGDKIGFSLDLNDSTVLMPHRAYQTTYAHWHVAIEETFVSALGPDQEYMPNRNALIMLRKMVDVFPSTRKSMDAILPLVDALAAGSREDLKVMAKGYTSLLKKKRQALKEDQASSLSPNKKDKSVGSKSPKPSQVRHSGKDKEGSATTTTSSSSSSSSSSRRQQQQQSPSPSSSSTNKPTLSSPTQKSSSSNVSKSAKVYVPPQQRKELKNSSNTEVSSSSSSSSSKRSRSIDRKAKPLELSSSSPSVSRREPRESRDAKEKKDGVPTETPAHKPSKVVSLLSKKRSREAEESLSAQDHTNTSNKHSTGGILKHPDEEPRQTKHRRMNHPTPRNNTTTTTTTHSGMRNQEDIISANERRIADEKRNRRGMDR